MKKAYFQAFLILFLIFLILMFSGYLEKFKEELVPIRTKQLEVIEPVICTTEACFKEKLANCEKALLVIREGVGSVKTQLELSIKEKRGTACIISVKLSEIELQTTGAESKAERNIYEALDSFFTELKKKHAECVFGEEDLGKISFSDTRFLFNDYCFGELKDSLGSLEQDIEKVVGQALGEVK